MPYRVQDRAGTLKEGELWARPAEKCSSFSQPPSQNQGPGGGEETRAYLVRAFPCSHMFVCLVCLFILPILKLKMQYMLMRKHSTVQKIIQEKVNAPGTRPQPLHKDTHN